jgi:putative membrane protein insertion efficiency factor
VNLVQHILVFGVRVYQRAISPALAALVGPYGRCRFEPSCSQYAVEAIQVHGVFKGVGLAAWRICRCAPWGGCGDDPVPPKEFKIESLRFKVADGAESCICQSHTTDAASGGRS